MSPDGAAIRKRRRVLSASALAVVVMPACLLLTAILPNSVRRFHVRDGSRHMRLPSYMASRGSAGQDQVVGSFLSTITVVVSDGLVLKLFPDTLMFYGCLELIVLAALAAAWFPSLARLCSRRRPGGFSVGECGVIGVLALLTIFWTTYWGTQHWYHGGKYAESTEVVARTFGQLAILFMSLALLPASRNSLWGEALGVSFQSSLWAHRWMGALSLVMTVCHFFAYWVRFAELDAFPHDVLNIHCYYPHFSPARSSDPRRFGTNFAVPLVQFIVYPGVVLMGVLPLVRRRNYEIFRYAHYVFLAIIPAVLLHANSGWYFLLGGMVFWVADASVRFVCAAQPRHLTSVKVHAADGGVTEIRFEMAFDQPGMYCFVSVPQISPWQWHPFSLASSPLDGWAQVNIKSMGLGTFTGDLYALARAHAELNHDGWVPITLNVDGPYGSALELDGRDTLLLIAGGIGITAVHSVLAHTLQRTELGELPDLRRIRLVWASRDSDAFAMFSSTMERASRASRLECTLNLHATSGKSHLSSHDSRGNYSQLPVTQGRPEFGSVLRELCEDGAANALAMVCGPETMVKSAADAARGCDWLSFESHLFVM